MLSLLHAERIKTSENLQKQNKFTSKLLVPTAVSIILAIAFGYFAPKPAPQWPNIDTFLNSIHLQRIKKQESAKLVTV